MYVVIVEVSSLQMCTLLYCESAYIYTVEPVHVHSIEGSKEVNITQMFASLPRDTTPLTLGIPFSEHCFVPFTYL